MLQSLRDTLHESGVHIISGGYSHFMLIYAKQSQKLQRCMEPSQHSYINVQYVLYRVYYKGGGECLPSTAKAFAGWGVQVYVCVSVESVCVVLFFFIQSH